MRKSKVCSVFILGFFVLAMGWTACAELGLQQILETQGNKAVGLAVRDAAKDIFNSDEEPKAILNKLTDIMNEAVYTGNEQTVRYVIIALMMAGGVENLELSKVAIDESKSFDVFPETTARTVAKMIWLLSGYRDIEAGGDEQSGGGGGEAGGEQDLGGGTPWDDDLFDPNINDSDLEATDT